MDSLTNDFINCSDLANVFQNPAMRMSMPINNESNIFTVMSSMMLFLILSLGGLVQLKIKQLSRFILTEMDAMSHKIVQGLTIPENLDALAESKKKTCNDASIIFGVYNFYIIFAHPVI